MSSIRALAFRFVDKRVRSIVGDDLVDLFPWRGDVHEMLWCGPISGTIVLLLILGSLLFVTLKWGFVATFIGMCATFLMVLAYEAFIRLVVKLALEHRDEMRDEIHNDTQRGCSDNLHYLYLGGGAQAELAPVGAGASGRPGHGLDRDGPGVVDV